MGPPLHSGPGGEVGEDCKSLPAQNVPAAPTCRLCWLGRQTIVAICPQLMGAAGYTYFSPNSRNRASRISTSSRLPARVAEVA